MRVALIVGTRPQIIKSIPVINAARRRNLEFEIVHTGQHYDELMSDVFFKSFEVPNAQINLGVGSGSHGYQVGEIITRLDKALSHNKPDAVLVPGDTNSAIAAAIFSTKCGITTGHIEAGARSGDMRMQEELNRRVIDHIGNVLFAVTESCAGNLRNEHVRGEVLRTGDTMLQVFQESGGMIRRSRVLSEAGLEPNTYAVLTLHRAENTSSLNFKTMLKAIGRLGVKVAFPVHPRTKRLTSQLDESESKNFIFTEPLDYFSMMKLVANSLFVATDSGGLQKEAFWSGVPCMTLRDVTEWSETVELGFNFLVGMDAKKLAATGKRILSENEEIRRRIRDSENPYASSGEPPGAAILNKIMRVKGW